MVLHVRYTAEAGSTALVQAARTNRAGVIPSHGLRLFVLNQEFGSQWQQFLSPAGSSDQELAFTIGRGQLPFAARTAKNIRLSRLDLIVASDHAGGFEVALKLPGATTASTEQLDRDDGLNDTHHLVVDPVTPQRSALGDCSLKIRKAGVTDFRSLTPGDLREAYLVIGFTTS